MRFAGHFAILFSSLLFQSVCSAQSCAAVNAADVFEVGPQRDMAGPVLNEGTYLACIMGQPDSYGRQAWRSYGPFRVKGGERYEISHSGGFGSRTTITSLKMAAGVFDVLLRNWSDARVKFAFVRVQAPSAGGGGSPVGVGEGGNAGKSPWGGTWTDTGSTCGGSTYTITQAADGAIQSIAIRVSCLGGRITGVGTGSGFAFKGPSTLTWSYRYVTHSPDLIETGTSELVLSADGKTAQLSSRDSAGNSGTSGLARKATTPADHNGTWTDTSDICGGSTYTIREAANGAIQSIAIRVSCVKGTITGVGTGSSFSWNGPSVLTWSYRYSSHSRELVQTGTSELVFADDGKTARLTSRDSTGNGGTSTLVRR